MTARAIPGQKRAFSWIAVWVIALVILATAISGALWGLGVITSGVAGKGNAIRIKNSATNRIQKQEMFEQLNADIAGYAAKISVAKEALAAASPADRPFRETELIGARQVCIDTVQQYNAESGKYTSRDFKSAGLPLTHDTEECK